MSIDVPRNEAHNPPVLASKRIFSLFSVLLGLFGASSVHAYKLPTEALSFDRLRPISATEVVDDDGNVLDYWPNGRFLLYRPLAEISKDLADLVVFTEDAKFWNHDGFDLAEIKNSIQENIDKGKVKRGASTITQQLAKNLFLDKERSFARKLFEIPWTYRIEKDLKKAQILELYLNIIEWGPGIYGAEAASRHFFDRPASELTMGQAMYLALIIPNPKRFDVFASPKTLEFMKTKQKWLVDRLVDEKRQPPEKKAELLALDFGLVAPDAPGRRFPVRHESHYFGSAASRSESLKTLESRLRPKARGKARVQLSLDRDKMKEMESAAVVEAEVPSQRIFAILEDNAIRAFRVVGKKKALTGSFTEVPSLDAVKLTPSPR